MGQALHERLFVEEDAALGGLGADHIQELQRVDGRLARAALQRTPALYIVQPFYYLLAPTKAYFILS